jgi:hypothetical protein
MAKYAIFLIGRPPFSVKVLGCSIFPYTLGRPFFILPGVRVHNLGIANLGI